MPDLPNKIYANPEYVIGAGFINGRRYEEYQSPNTTGYIREDLVEALINAIGEYAFNNTDALLDDVQQAISNIRGKE